ncbi:MAG TPA: PKD domain-containing protein [Bacteroidia bacterium]|jgi:gliding motility-associated-like protein|nr:PKD domain-containing protein [Bacteroidia bacterium]
MKKIKLLVFVLFFLLKITPVVSQIDTVFWFAAPWVTPDHTWKDPYKVHIAGDVGTVVRVRQPGAILPNKYDTTFTIPASRAFDYTFWRDAAAGPTNLGFDSLESRPANTVLPYGLKITSSSKITVVYDVITRAPTFYNPETFSMKGQNGLGVEFVCPFQNTWVNVTLGSDLNGDAIITQPKQQINIVSTMPGTIVWITPRCNVVGHPANITYSIAMGYGDVYTVQNVTQATSTLTPGQNLGGTIVVSNNPISVTIADDSLITPGGGCYDLIGDQIVPVDVVGDSYIANRGFMFPASGESIFVVATVNFTQITINDGVASTYTLNKGDTKQYQMTNPLAYIQATQPVYLWQTTGYGCEPGAAILPPLDCAGSDTVVFSRNNTQPFLINVVCKTGNQGNFKIDGNPALLVASDFTVVPGTAGAWMGAQKQYTPAVLGIGAHEIRNSTDVFALGIINGNTNTGGLFHYMSTFRRKVRNNAGPDFTVCAGATNTIALSGTITGGAITGQWYAPITGSINPAVYTSSITTISTVYTLSPAQLSQPALTSIVFTLTSLGNCKNVSDTVRLYIYPKPSIALTPSVVTRCKNNLTPIALSGSVANVISQTWSGGSGSFSSITSANTTYTPSPGDASAGSVTITLNAMGCVGVSTNMVINFTNPPTVSTPPDINVCTNTPTVAVNGATITGGSSTGIWSTNGGGYFTPTDTTFNTNYVLSAAETATGGIVTLTLTSTNNGLCAVVHNTLNINIYPKPIVNAGPNYTTCASAVIFTLSGSATFQSAPTTPTWSAVSGTGAFSNINVPNPTYTMSINDTIQGFVILVISAQGICPNPVTDTIRIDILKLPNVNAGINTSVCDNSNINLSGNISGFTTTGQWSSSGTGTFTPNNTNLNTSYVPSGSDIFSGSVTFTLASTNNQGCSTVKDTLKITFKASPTANFNIGAACVNSPVAFINSSTGTIVSQTWGFGDGFTSISNNPLHTYTLANTYTVALAVSSANGCTDTITKPIVINSLPVPNFYFANACVSLLTIFKDSSFVNPGNIVNWHWDFADGGKDTINKNPGHVYLSAGLYNVNLVVTSNKGCKSSISKPVTVYPKPKAEYGMTNNPTLALETVYFSDFSTPAGTISNWYWNFGDSISANGQNPTHFYNNQGNYNVTLTIIDGNGCRDSITKSIEVALLPLVPTAFSPNKDGNNDYLFVKGGPFEKMYFRVYNNWGELIFETKDQKVGWDGTYQGIESPIGVYVWVLDVDMYNNKSVRKTGDVTILR